MKNLKYSLIEIIINIALSLVLVRHLKHTGLALATTIAAILTFPIYITELKRIASTELMKKRLIKIIKVCIASLGLVTASFETSRILNALFPVGDIGDLLHLFISVCSGSAVFLMISYALHIEECVDIVIKIKTIVNQRGRID